MDHDAFQSFYESTARGLKKYMISLLRNQDKADDVVQESYLCMLKIDKEMNEQHRKNYLYTVAKHLAMREWQKSQKQAEAFDWTLLEAPDHEIAMQEDMRCLLQKITDRQKELLWLAYVEQFSHSEIARIIGVKTESVRPMLARARDHFASVLRQHGVGSTDTARIRS